MTKCEDSARNFHTENSDIAMPLTACDIVSTGREIKAQM